MPKKPRNTPTRKLEIVTASYQIGFRQTEKLYGVTTKTIQAWRRIYRDDGLAGLEKNNRGANRKNKIFECQKEAILELAASFPKISNREIVERLNLNCSSQAVMIFRDKMAKKGATVTLTGNWYFDYDKLSCTVDGKTAYLLTATENQSGLTLACTTDENIPIYLHAFVEYIVSFLQSVEPDSSIKILVSSSRFISKNAKNFKATGFLDIEYKKGGHKRAKSLPEYLKKKFASLPSDFKTHLELLCFLDDIFFNMNVRLQADNANLLQFQPMTISINSDIGSHNKKSIGQIADRLVQIIDIEITKFNLTTAKSLLTYLIKLGSFYDSSSELQIKTQMLIANAYLNSYDYKKAFYHYSKSLKTAKALGNEQFIIKTKIAIANYYLITSQYHKCEIKLSNALNLSRKIADKKSECHILGKLGQLYKITNDQRAATVADLQLELAIEEDDKELYCESMNLMSTIYFATGSYEKGLSCAHKSLNLAIKYNYPQAIFEANFNIAEYALRTNNFSLAEKHLQLNNKESLSYENYSPDDLKNLIRLGLTKCECNDTKSGRGLLEKCLYLAQKRADRFSESLSYYYLGQSYSYQRDFKKAAFYFKKAARINDQIGNKEQQIIILGGLSACYGAMKQYDKSLRYAKKKFDEAKSTKNRMQIAAAYGSIAIASFYKNEYENALQYYQLQLKTLKPTESDLNKALTIANIGLVHLACNNYLSAQSYYKKAVKKLIILGNNLYLGKIYLDLAKIAQATGNGKKLKEYVELAKDKAGLAGDTGIVELADELLNS